MSVLTNLTFFTHLSLKQELESSYTTFFYPNTKLNGFMSHKICVLKQIIKRLNPLN